jgi:hypothetical protein
VLTMQAALLYLQAPTDKEEVSTAVTSLSPYTGSYLVRLHSQLSQHTTETAFTI